MDRYNLKKENNTLDRKCPFCKKILPLTEFSRNSKTRLGVCCYCRKCVKAKNKLYGPDNYKRAKAKWMSTTYRERVTKDPRKSMLQKCQGRARAIGRECNINVEDIVIPEYCPILGTKLELFSSDHKRRPSVDRVDNTKGYVKGNVRVISQAANSMKSWHTLETLRKMIDYIEGRI